MLVPEIYCRDVAVSKSFYVDELGFLVRNERLDEGFLHVQLGIAEIMIEELDVSGRNWLLAPLEYPFGRGVSFEITVDDVDAIGQRSLLASHQRFLPMEEKWYRVGNSEVGVRQFIIADPDGYLLRFSQEIGRRSI